MKNYLAILAHYVGIIIVSVLLTVMLVTHAPWWVLIPLVMIGACGAAYTNFRRFYGIDNNSTMENNR